MKTPSRLVQRGCAAGLLLLVIGTVHCTRPPTGQWTVERDHFGPIRFGIAVADAEQVLGVPFHQTQDLINACTYVTSRAMPAGAAFMVRDGRIVRVDIDSATVRTNAGATVGMSESDVLARYPNSLRVTAHPYPPPGAHYLVYVPRDPADTLFGMIFETDGRIVTSYRAGELSAVRLIEGCA